MPYSGIFLSQRKKNPSQLLLVFFLHIFLARVHVPVPDDLQSNHGVDEAAADISEDEDLVPSLLDAGEDPGDGTDAEQEAGDG